MMIEALRMEFDPHVPPQSIDAEQNVLGVLMLDNSAYDRVSDLIEESDFYRLEHRQAFKVISQLIEASKPADVITVSEAQGGELSYLGELVTGTVSTTNVRRYAEIVRERSRKRQAIGLATEIADLAYTAGSDIEGIIDRGIEGLYALKQRERRRGSRPIGKILSAVVERIDALYSRKDEGAVIGLPTGFVDLDRMTAGFQGGDLIIVAGRPSMGKTTMAMNVVEHVAITEQKPVLVFSLEMSDEQLAQRMIGSVGRIDQHELRTARFPQEDWNRVTHAVEKLDASPIVIEETSALTVAGVRSTAFREHRQNGGLGLIVIDYLQLMSVSGSDNRNNELGEITRGLKMLAKDLRVPIVLLSQLNRGVEQRQNKRPMLSDLRDSGSIEQDADIVLLLYRDEFYNKDTQFPGVAELIVAKQRNGPTGTIYLTFLGKFTRFENYAGEPRRSSSAPVKASSFYSRGADA
jgi:replicative DNA helicase